VVIVAVPSFDRSGLMVLLNLKTMAIHPIAFGAQL
jgi:hypothetical protein